MKKLSKATQRAMDRGYYQNSDWFCDFHISDVKGDLTYEKNIHRRDPSSVIKVDGLYYTWYSKSVGNSVGFLTGDENAKVFPWDYTEIWYATSEDTYTWKEQGPAILRGEKGRYDDRSVFTPEVYTENGKYYLVYQVVQSPYLVRSFEYIAMAWADNPNGPWTKSDKPVVSPSKDGVWADDDVTNRFNVSKKGSFDSLKVHDPLLLKLGDKYMLYFKGEPMGEEFFMGGRETKWGVAIADNVLGPYTKSEYNPVTNSGHETCLWNYNGGIAAFLSTDGVEKNSMQYAKDGINFDVKSVIKAGPEAAGPYRDPVHQNDTNLSGMTWGLCHEINSDWGFIKRFDIDFTQRLQYTSKKPFE